MLKYYLFRKDNEYFKNKIIILIRFSCGDI